MSASEVTSEEYWGTCDVAPNALSGLLSRLHNVLLNAVNSSLGDRGPLSELGLAPAQHSPRRSNFSTELH
jgi:hypothetical protein